MAAYQIVGALTYQYGWQPNLPKPPGQRLLQVQPETSCFLEKDHAI